MSQNDVQPNQLDPSEQRADTLLEVDSLNVEYAVGKERFKALRDVSISIGPRETLGIAGESGSGKSTLALAIVGYLDDNGEITNGDVRFKGTSLTSASKTELQSIRGGQIAHVPQDPNKSLNPSIRIGEQIRETIALHQDIPDRERQMERVYEVLEEVNIPDPEYTATQYPHELSGGMQQRALLSIGLSCNPDLLILDEPTTGLDVTTQAKILDLIEDLKDRFDMATLLITHDLSVIARIAERTNILYAGELMEEGATHDVFTNPANPYTQGLLAATPEIDKNKKLRPIPGQLPDLIDVPQGCIFADRCEFADDDCRVAPIENERVGDRHDHLTRCRRWETAVDNPIRTETERRNRSTAGDVLLEIENVQKYYGESGFLKSLLGTQRYTKAVNGVNLTIAESEVVGLVGESGCGKSTLGRCILGLDDATGGVVKYKGKDIQSLSKHEMREFRSDCQIVFQNPDSSLNPTKTVSDILRRPIELFSSYDDVDARIETLLDQVKLGSRVQSKYPHELSGGQQQRVAIARAFATDPSFVVLDEPVSSLDVSVQASIISLLNELRTKYNTSYLLISHDLSVVNSICDRISVMYLGKFVETGTSVDIFNPPHHPYTSALLSSSPSLDPGQQRDRIHLEGDVPSAHNPPSGCSFHTRCPKKIGDICEQEEPALSEVGDGHCTACLLDVEDLY